MMSTGAHTIEVDSLIVKVRPLWPWLLALGVLAIFLVTGVRHLDAVPQVYEDEPWQASTGYRLATQGVFGSDLFAGFFDMDQRYYGFMPLHPLLLAATFRLIGLGLAQARLETVLLTALTLVLTFALGARLFSAWVGAVAVALLVLVRWTGLTYVQLTGIPLVDFARIARYDPLVPAIGLAALHVYLSARKRARAWLYLLAGILAGLCGLAHVYGLFWVPALLVLALWDGQRRLTVFIALGAVLPWLPYAAYVLTDLPDWRGQTAIYATRFELLNPAWYAANLAQEYHRYGPGLGPPGVGWLLRPGFWLVCVALPLSLIGLTRRALACDAAARAIVVPALLFPVLFALTITLKLVNYTLIELPIFALAIAWGLLSFWSRGVWLKAVLGVASVAVVVEGSVALAHLEQAAATTTPYPTFIAEVRQYVPPDARILGLHSYWIGFQDHDYRSFLVPLNMTDLGVPLDQALSDIDPDVVLLDARMRAYFDSAPASADAALFQTWLARHDAQLLGQVDDPTYGLMEIYRVNR
jgi:4-amino-4-deoxy-L-arabinose transferase-like glycosyltransferase